MRGKDTMIDVTISAFRITPAYAGKSQQRGSGYNDRWDHPRLCGEKFSLLSKSLRLPWITPAYAGKRNLIILNKIDWKDHPRLCGEKPSPAKRNCYKTGSPPPMRGKVANDPDIPPEVGITPAYAGKSSRYGLFCAENKDHPRLCGEKPP